MATAMAILTTIDTAIAMATAMAMITVMDTAIAMTIVTVTDRAN